MSRSLHEIGLVGPDAILCGPPIVRAAINGIDLGYPDGCPNCMCHTFFQIEAPVYSLAGPYADVAYYVGCPACAWATPVTISTPRTYVHKRAKPNPYGEMMFGAYGYPPNPAIINKLKKK